MRPNLPPKIKIGVTTRNLSATKKHKTSSTKLSNNCESKHTPPKGSTISKANTYNPEKVWQWQSESDDAFATINRPIAGATHNKELAYGKHRSKNQSAKHQQSVSL